MIELTSSHRRTLRARAHNLHPVASISQNGLSEAVLSEIDRSLKAHELIKVRIGAQDRDERATLIDQLCERTDAAKVQTVGKIAVLWRPRPLDEDED